MSKHRAARTIAARRVRARVRFRNAREPGACDRCGRRYAEGDPVLSVNGGPWVCAAHAPGIR